MHIQEERPVRQTLHLDSAILAQGLALSAKLLWHADGEKCCRLTPLGLCERDM